MAVEVMEADWSQSGTNTIKCKEREHQHLSTSYGSVPVSAPDLDVGADHTYVSFHEARYTSQCQDTNLEAGARAKPQ